MTDLAALPVAIVGAGPIGLAAAAHMTARGQPFRLYEAGPDIGHNVAAWGHVRIFTPWRYCVDPVAAALLAEAGWTMPPEDDLPTGADFIARCLKPLAALPAIAAGIATGARVTAITRDGADKVTSRDRAARPFVLTVTTASGTRRDQARAVIDASGTWATPNPLGAGGLPAEGETDHADRIAYGIPDVLARDRDLYAGRTTLVVGAGHSAANALIDLARLADEVPGTRTLWATRGTSLAKIYGGGAADDLPARGDLGTGLRHLVETGRIALATGLAITAIGDDGTGRLMVEGMTAMGPRTIGPVDRLIVATGQRPDLSLTRELRLDLDPWLESARALGPLIDPNLHSCGSVPPHGHRELGHPEPGFYTIGIKSYGRAPTFLMLTGFEQARSVVAALSGDVAAADAVHLVLPETGICATDPESTGGATCCGGPAPAGVEACCQDDAAAKADGASGCGCAPAPAPAAVSCCGTRTAA